MKPRSITLFLLVSLLAACQSGALTGEIPGTLSRTPTLIKANGQNGGVTAPANGIPALLVPVNINGAPLNAPPQTPTPPISAVPTPAATALLTPAPASTTSDGSGGGGSGGGGVGGGGAVVTPAATPSVAASVVPSALPSSAGFQNLHGQVVTLAGNGTAMVGGTGALADPRNAGDGIGTSALLNGPGGLMVDPKSGIVYFSDSNSALVRTLSLAAQVRTQAGGLSYHPITPATNGQSTCALVVSANTTDKLWDFQPYDFNAACEGLAAGTPANYPYDGTGINSRFGSPSGIAADSKGDLYVADTGLGTLRKLTLSNGGAWTVATFAIGMSRPRGVVCDNSSYPPTIYVTDSGSNCIYRIPSIAPGTTNYNVGAPFVGSLVPGFADDTASKARFNSPMGITRAPNGDMFVADANNNAIRRVDPNGNVSTLCGSGARGLMDGTGANARFWYPIGLALDDTGNLFVADSQNQVIRMVSPLGTVSTLAGVQGNAGFADDVFAKAKFNLPTDVAVDSFGNLFVADFGNNRIRQIIR